MGLTDRSPKGRGESFLALFRLHRDVAVQGGAVFHGEAGDLDVPVQVARTAEGQALFRGHVAGDLPADADVRSLDRGLDRGPRVDGDVSAGFELAFDVAGDLEVALDLEASVQAVART